MKDLSTIEVARLLRLVALQFDTICLGILSDCGIDHDDDRICDVECIEIVDLLYKLSNELSKRKQLPF